jgi:hypothetical protein
VLLDGAPAGSANALLASLGACLAFPCGRTPKANTAATAKILAGGRGKSVWAGTRFANRRPLWRMKSKGVVALAHHAPDDALTDDDSFVDKFHFATRAVARSQIVEGALVTDRQWRRLRPVAYA